MDNEPNPAEIIANPEDEYDPGSPANLTGYVSEDAGARIISRPLSRHSTAKSVELQAQSEERAAVPTPADNFNRFRRRSLSSNLGLKSPGTFIMATKDHKDVTRQQMIEYLTLQKWSRASCKPAPLAILLWLILLALVSVRSHTEQSFYVREALSNELQNLTADKTRGNAPNRIYTEAGADGITCKCSCAYERGAVCRTSGDRNKRFEGEIGLAELQLLRARASYNDTDARSQTMRWQDIRSIPDTWFWVQHGLLPHIWKEEAHSSPIDLGSLFGSLGAANSTTGEPAGMLTSWNQIIGGVRLRERRLQERSCRVDPKISAMYQTACHSSEPTLDPYGPGLRSYTPGYIPTQGVPGAFDVHFDVGRPPHVMFENIEHMLKAYGWLDSASKSLYVQAAFLNAEAEPPLFGLLEVRFEFQRSGGLYHEVHVDTVAAEPYPTFLHVLLDFIWVCGVFFLLVRQSMRVCCGRHKHFTLYEINHLDFWTTLDWVTLFLSFAIAISFVLQAFETGSVSTAIAALPAAPLGDEATPEALRQFHALWVDILDRVSFLTVWAEYHRLGMFWYTLVLTLQFFSVFRGQPKLAQMAKTLWNAAEDLLHFLLLFLILFLNFAFSGYMLFGLVLEDWSTPAKAVNSTFQALTGFIDLASMYEVAPVSTVFWFMLFIVSMIFVMLNLLLATIFDHFSIVKARAGQNTGIWSQLRWVMRDLWARPWLVSNEAFPPHHVMLDELIARARLPVAVREGIRDSVLGSKWCRTEREKFIFAGKIVEDDLGGGNPATEKVGPDLYEMSVDRDYADLLEEECYEYGMAEYDPEEMRIAQLRELVTLAETDVGLMRSRLADCQDVTGSNMRKLSRRLVDLENLVHAKLHELVQIAETAGVPTAGQKFDPATQGKLNRAGRGGFSPSSTMSKTSDLIATFGRKSAERREAEKGGSIKLRRQSMEMGDAEPMLKHLQEHDKMMSPPTSPKSEHVEKWDRALRKTGVSGKRLGPETPYR